MKKEKEKRKWTRIKIIIIIENTMGIDWFPKGGVVRGHVPSERRRKEKRKTREMPARSWLETRDG